MHEIVVRHTRRTFGEQRQHDEATVAVREAFAGRELLRVAVELGTNDSVVSSRWTGTGMAYSSTLPIVSSSR